MENLKNKKPLTVLSFGAGQDSTAILYKFILDPSFKETYSGGTDLICIFSDTGNEHPDTYRHVRYCQGLAEKHGILFFHIAPDMGFHSPAWRSLEGQMLRNSTLMMRGSKSCTDNLKIQPIYRFLNSFIGERYGFNFDKADYGKKNIVKYAEIFGKISMIIGIAKGEEKRKEKADKLWPSLSKWLVGSVERVYPLLTTGFGRSECQAFMSASGFEICIPSNCMMCPYIAKQELLLLSIDNPEVFERWKGYEAAKLEKNKEAVKNFGVFGTAKTLADHVADAAVKYADMSVEDLRAYKMSHGHCISNAY